VDGCLPNSQGGSPRGNANDLEASPSKKKERKKREKKEKEKKSKFFKPHEVKGHHKSVHQAVLTKGKYPSTPEATPKQ
jgi:hypothetical protein